MGNACGTYQNPDLQRQMESIKIRDPNQPLTLNKLRQLSQYYIVSRNIPEDDAYHVQMLVSIRQLHLAEHLRKLSGKDKQQFMKKLKQIDFEELDIMSNQALLNKSHRKQYKPYSNKQTLSIRYKLEQKANYYDNGDSVIKNRAAGLLVLIGCFGGNNDFDALSCLQELKTPSKKPCLQILLERVCYLNQTNNSNIHIIIVVESKYQNKVLKALKKYELNLNITVKSYKTSIPNVFLNGQIALQNQKQFSFSEGTGDFLREINKLGIIQKLKAQNIEYLHIIRSTNILEKVCDPFVLGYLEQEKVDVVSKLVPAQKNEIGTGHLYLVETQSQSICIKSHVPHETKKYIFTDSIFMRLSYLQSLSKESAPLANQKIKCKQCKISSYDPLNQRFAFANSNNAMYFYRNPADLIVGNNCRFIIVASEFEYCHIDIDPQPEIALSNNFKQELGIEHSNPTDLIEISPLIYYDSNKGAEQVKKMLEETNEIGYPCYIRKIQEGND